MNRDATNQGSRGVVEENLPDFVVRTCTNFFFFSLFWFSLLLLLHFCEFWFYCIMVQGAELSSSSIGVVPFPSFEASCYRAYWIFYVSEVKRIVSHFSVTLIAHSSALLILIRCECGSLQGEGGLAAESGEIRLRRSVAEWRCRIQNSNSNSSKIQLKFRLG